MPSRLEGLLSLLIASPMTMLGCGTDPVPADTEGSSSSGAGPGTSSSGMADTGSTSIVTTGDDTTGTTGGTGSSSTTDATSGTSTTDATSGSSSTTSDDTTDEGGSSTTDGAAMGNTCERVGDLMDECFAGGGYYYNYYEQACNSNINYYIAAGDYACAQAWNEYYACIADLDCVEVFMGVWSNCQEQYGNVESVCFDWGGTDSFGTDSFGGTFGDSGGFEDGVVFIVPETSGFGTTT